MSLLEIMLMLIGIILLISCLFIGAGFYFYRFAIKRNSKEFLTEDQEIGNALEESSKHLTWYFEQQKEEYSIESHDGFQLKAKFIKGGTEQKTFAILVHGYMSQHQDMAGFAQMFHTKYQFHILMPDCRGHGKSEGHYIGFGYHDRLDILSWIDHLIKQHGEDIQIILFGISMGGATVSFVSGEKLPEQVKCIITDCAYDDIKGILKYHMRRMFHLKPFPLLNITSLITKLRAGYSFENKSIANYVRKSKVPILFIHGGDDLFVPTKMVYSLYNACLADKRLLIVKGASHGVAYIADPITYEKVVDEFINKYIR
jgi:uncharacterized protein